ncbi:MULTISPECIES: 2-polyprenyl-3-methyl-6-methoxy-1,4-benzoquinone monooxygenase [unclassified Modicisalibacter]|uniref:2-polyprenyl-3-methyl-6-methoxy-1,4-benzoquinone monooxygenase n=1 Tax=unclassified Modicisalibacter TaxID=2679913 RepID=UPI001CC9DB1F|nr:MULTISPECIES: 2-polyprenyl-3-methyl-6-methoxy-1,4-benzoquinone monooxygenase [unclassified Modicisalibacter]MBZ9559327.1 2-polyprenyl-3-methyl-6-methoxy-1,4-benzoquinone monooxygenase [Modicisalibacter sp. R2A 31.J]MBZ9576508.1 2-polyprenyl-3-methyl-6-methoxy-1,4-benzoquinone monooxygenase [Modicisalibacter sp. MOD 31.J]
MLRKLTRTDQLIHQFDTVLRTLVPHAAQPSRPSPAGDTRDETLDPDARRHAAGLMRINHTGEVCAQALYQGQGMTAQLADVRTQMEQAAQEEIDHLAWCDARLVELDGRTSYLNPLFYAASFGIGAVAGAVGDRVSLGFVNATEEQVGKHLDDHLEKLPMGDRRSRAILEQMREDEAHHARWALEAGGKRFPAPVKFGMSLMSKVMTQSVYRL